VTTLRLRVAITDYDWYEFLKGIKADEVNFWMPSGKNAFRALAENELLLFKLHYPRNVIVGGGFFISYSPLPVSLAWDTFQYKNGTDSYETFIRRIKKYRGGNLSSPDPVIGCIILSEPFFFEQKDWIPAPEDWSPNIVQGKNYDDTTEIGRRLFTSVEERMQYNPLQTTENIRYGKEQTIKPRIGQGAFRVLVTEAYDRRCAVTGERTLPALEASHIKPFACNGPNMTGNGLLLRKDIHALFDSGYLTITEDYHIEVSRKIKEEYGNGRDYYALHGNALKIVPDRTTDRPVKEFIIWHNNNRYVG
jgi:putative restriction endonuclease